MKHAPSLAAGLLMCACTSTPQHSNTLIFGTTTLIALDVSSNATNAPGVTLGYKRAEVVWMPLMANKEMNGDGGKTTVDECPPTSDQSAPTAEKSASASMTCAAKFVGEGADGTRDTYSVLASFGGDLSGNSAGPEAGATIKQFFATGLAARKLAETGGAALLNTNAKAPGASSAALDQVSTKALEAVDRIVSAVTAPDGTLDATKRDAWLKSAQSQSGIPGVRLEPISAMTTGQQLRSYLRTFDINEIHALAASAPPRN